MTTSWDSPGIRQDTRGNDTGQMAINAREYKVLIVYFLIKTGIAQRPVHNRTRRVLVNIAKSRDKPSDAVSRQVKKGIFDCLRSPEKDRCIALNDSANF